MKSDSKNTDSPNTVNLVAYTDERYIPHLTAMLRSAVDHLRDGWQLRVFVLNNGVSERSQMKVAASLPEGRVHFEWSYQSEAGLEEAFSNTLPYISSVTFYRLLLDRHLPDTVERVLVLDSDLIVCGDLVELWEEPLAGAVAGAVLNMGWSLVAMNDDGVFAERNVPGSDPYFNAGVLLIDVHLWRQKKMGRHLIDLARKYGPRVRLSDQCILNLGLVGQWKALPPEWNQQTGIFDFPSHYGSQLSKSQYQRVCHSPKIVHFTSPFKPWLPNCTHPWREVYREFSEKTQFDSPALEAAPHSWELIRRSLANSYTSLHYALMRMRVLRKLRRPIVPELIGILLLFRQLAWDDPVVAFLLPPYVFGRLALPRRLVLSKPLTTFLQQRK